MNDVVERVARAIARGCGLDPDAISPRAKERAGHEIPEWMFFGPAARAAIEAMREPSPQMLAAVDDEASDKFVARGRAYSAWVSMIDAALADASPDIGKEGIGKCEVPGCNNQTNLGICDDCDQWVTDMVAADQGVPPIVAEINEAIAAWHDGAGAGKSLHDFLGWSFDEYTAWVADETAIPDRALATPPSSDPTP